MIRSMFPDKIWRPESLQNRFEIRRRASMVLASFFPGVKGSGSWAPVKTLSNKAESEKTVGACKMQTRIKSIPLVCKDVGGRLGVGVCKLSWAMHRKKRLYHTREAHVDRPCSHYLFKNRAMRSTKLAGHGRRWLQHFDVLFKYNKLVACQTVLILDLENKVKTKKTKRRYHVTDEFESSDWNCESFFCTAATLIAWKLVYVD